MNLFQKTKVFWTVVYIVWDISIRDDCLPAHSILKIEHQMCQDDTYFWWIWESYIHVCLYIYTTNLLRTADSLLQHVNCILSLPLTQRGRFITALGFHRNHTTVLQTLEQTAATQRAVPHLTRGTWSTIVIRTNWSHRNNIVTLILSQERELILHANAQCGILTALVLGDTESRVCSVQDATAFTNALLSDRSTGALLVVISVLTCSGLTCIHTWFIFLTRRTFECCKM